MTTTTIAPLDAGQTQLMLDSPMTDAEQAQLEKIQSRATSSAGKITINKIEMAQCLLEVYNDKLFRGKTGGRTWGDYLKSHDFGKLGFPNALNTDMATHHLNYAALCDAIDDWNDDNPTRELPYPAGPTHLQGWTTLFDRTASVSGVQAMSTYAPITGAKTALKTWYTAVVNNDGQAPDRSTTQACGRKARDSGFGRDRLAGSDNSTNLISRAPSTDRSDSQPESVARTISPQQRMEAAAAQLEREQRNATIRAEEQSLRQDGIDPRSVSVMQKDSDFDVMSECETYSGLLNQTSHEIQRLDVWARGRLNQYGTDGLNMLRQFDAGLYTIKDDISAITLMGERLIELAALLQDHVEPGSMVEGLYESEPTL
jgi:hypothetical protein